MNDCYEHPGLKTMLARMGKPTPQSRDAPSPVTGLKAASLRLSRDEINDGVKLVTVIRYRGVTIVFVSADDVTSFGSNYSPDPISAVSYARARAHQKFKERLDVLGEQDVEIEEIGGMD